MKTFTYNKLYFFKYFNKNDCDEMPNAYFTPFVFMVFDISTLFVYSLMKYILYTNCRGLREKYLNSEVWLYTLFMFLQLIINITHSFL